MYNISMSGSVLEKYNALKRQQDADRADSRTPVNPHSSPESTTRVVYSDDEAKLVAAKRQLRIEQHLQEIAQGLGGRVEQEDPENHLSGQQSWRIILKEKKTLTGRTGVIVPVSIDASWQETKLDVGDVSNGTVREATEGQFTDLLAQHTLDAMNSEPIQFETNDLGRLIADIKEPGREQRIDREARLRNYQPPNH